MSLSLDEGDMRHDKGACLGMQEMLGYVPSAKRTPQHG
jgi:hypothetical protein